MTDSLRSRIESLIGRKGDKVFLRSIGRGRAVEEYTYKGAIDRALAVARLYDKFGAAPGRTVVLVLSDPREVFFYAVGALLTGRVPIISAHPSAKLPVADFARTLLPLIANADPALIIADADYCVMLSHALALRVASPADLETDAQPAAIAIKPDAPLFIQYSSGTTGTKKGVCIAEDQLLWQVDAYAEAIGLDDNDHIVSWLPLYHDMGLITALMMPLLTATTVTMMSPFAWVQQPMMLLETISQDRGTLCWLPNFAYNFLAKSARRAQSALDLSFLRGVVNCSEPVSAESHRLFREAFADAGLKPEALAVSYAMAETTFAVTSGGFGRPMRSELFDRAGMAPGQAVTAGKDAVVSCGRPLRDTVVHIFGADGGTLEDGYVGEIGVRSPSVMSGYFKNGEATHTATAQTPDGAFFMTGDIGFIADGDVFVTGRAKDLIITAGRNIYPQDVEAAVNEIPGVIGGRCVTFGIPDAQKGTEAVVIIAESAAQAGPDKERLSQRIAQEITALFDIALADVVIAEPRWLRKSTSGKISRTANRALYLDMRAAAAPKTATAREPADLIREAIHKASGKWVDDIHAPLLTSGLIDSLGLTHMMLEIEEAFATQLPMPDEAGYGAYDSIANIAILIGSGQKPAPPPAKVMTDRQLKVNYFLGGPRDYNGVILGSSRTFSLRAATAARLGVRSFHFGGSNVNIEEIYCMLHLAADRSAAKPAHAILGIDPTMFIATWPLDLRFVAVRQLVDYLDPADRRDAGGLQWPDAGDDLSKLRNAEYERKARLRYKEFDVNALFDADTGDMLTLNPNRLDDPPPLKIDLAQVDTALPLILAKQAAAAHPRRLDYLAKIVRFCAQAGIKLHVYCNPLPPGVIDLLQASTRYFKAQDALLTGITNMYAPGVYVHNTRTPADFGGDPDDYSDSTHMGLYNGDRLLAFMLERAP